MPFSVIKSSRRTLVEQVVDGLRQGIATGVWKTGEILPTTRDLAERLGVSRIVTRAAVRELSEAGLVNPKPGIGCIVLGGHGKLWKGRVLLVSLTNGFIYYENVFVAALRERLVRAGWLVVPVTVAASAKDPLAASELEVQCSHSTDLAVNLFDSPVAERVLSRAGVPFVSIGNRAGCNRKGCVGYVRYDRSTAARELAAACARIRVRNVLQVGMEDFDDLGAALRDVGIASDVWTIPPPRGSVGPERVARAAYDAFVRRFSPVRGQLPDLLYFSDDHTCRGALMALAEAGIRSPADVRIVTWANRGNSPVYAKPLARMEMDPVADAERVFEICGNVLARREQVGAHVLGPTYFGGETMPQQEMQSTSQEVEQDEK